MDVCANVHGGQDHLVQQGRVTWKHARQTDSDDRAGRTEGTREPEAQALTAKSAHPSSVPATTNGRMDPPKLSSDLYTCSV